MSRPRRAHAQVDIARDSRASRWPLLARLDGLSKHCLREPVAVVCAGPVVPPENRHCTRTLLLGGWLLVYPTVDRYKMIAFRGPDGRYSRVVMSDPLGKLPPISLTTWVQVSAHDTASDCEHARARFLKTEVKDSERQAWRWAEGEERGPRRTGADMRVSLA